jgi:TRL-like protein family
MWVWRINPTAAVNATQRLSRTEIYMIRLVVIAATLWLSGCIYTGVKFPLDRDLWETKLGAKVGVASNYSIAWLVAWGDAGIEAAARAGGITQVQHADMAVTSYLAGLYVRLDTIVYGD